jgi:hypothetical protein
MRRTFRRLAGEFDTTNAKDHAARPTRYGQGYYSHGTCRNFWKKSTVYATDDRNRLTAYEQRYAPIIAEFDIEKSLEKCKVSLDDLRTDDHRRVWFKCAQCSRGYYRSMKQRLQHRTSCATCARAGPSAIASLAPAAKPVAETHKALLQAATEGDRQILSTVGATSRFRAKWTCGSCSATFVAPVRTRTGDAAPGVLAPPDKKHFQQCPTCTFTATMKYAMTARGGSLLGVAI